MCNELFSIGKFTVHGYSVMIAIGFLLGISLCCLKAKKDKKNPDTIMDIALIALIAGFVGAKILYIIVDFKELFVRPLDVIGFSGFVAYGGIIGGTLAIIVFCRIKKIKPFEYLDFMVPFVSLVQGFGRLGCFMAGCCYGAPTDSFLGVTFPEGAIAPSGIKLWPTQLFSAGGDFIICAILLIFSKYNKKNGNVCSMYLCLYGVGRFLVEILRNDPRGTVGIFSTSQFISLFIVAAGIIGFVYVNVINKKKNTEVDSNEK